MKCVLKSGFIAMLCRYLIDPVCWVPWDSVTLDVCPLCIMMNIKTKAHDRIQAKE